MATTKQKAAAKKNIKKARAAQSARAHGKSAPRKKTAGLSTAEKNDLPASKFAFPDERKEPLTDARHVRNAIARFDQVEGVSDAPLVTPEPSHLELPQARELRQGREVSRRGDLTVRGQAVRIDVAGLRHAEPLRVLVHQCRETVNRTAQALGENHSHIVG